MPEWRWPEVFGGELLIGEWESVDTPGLVLKLKRSGEFTIDVPPKGVVDRAVGSLFGNRVGGEWSLKDHELRLKATFAGSRSGKSSEVLLPGFGKFLAAIYDALGISPEDYTLTIDACCCSMVFLVDPAVHFHRRSPRPHWLPS